jgi:hypothetical protein
MADILKRIRFPYQVDSVNNVEWIFDCARLVSRTQHDNDFIGDA